MFDKLILLSVGKMISTVLFVTCDVDRPGIGQSIRFVCTSVSLILCLLDFKNVTASLVLIR